MQNLTQFAAALFNPADVFDPVVIDAEAVAQAEAPMLGLAAELADVVCNAGMAEAERIARMVQCVRGAVDPKGMMKRLCDDFAAALEAHGYKGAAQRKSDLKAILKAALAHPDYVVDGPGLQGMAKHARGFGKPPKAAQTEQADEVIEIQAIPDMMVQCMALVDNARDHGEDGFADALMVLARRYNIL